MNELILPWPHKDLSPNARKHWRARQRESKKGRALAYLVAIEAGLKLAQIPAGRLHLHITFHPPTRRLPDDDNMLARFKPYRDGIADALGIDDKRFISHPLVSTEVRKGGQVVVRITGGPAG